MSLQGSNVNLSQMANGGTDKDALVKKNKKSQVAPSDSVELQEVKIAKDDGVSCHVQNQKKMISTLRT